MNEELKKKEQKRDRMRSLKDIGDEVTGSIFFEFAANLLLFIPRALFRLFKNS